MHVNYQAVGIKVPSEVCRLPRSTAYTVSPRCGLLLLVLLLLGSLEDGQFLLVGQWQSPFLQVRGHNLNPIGSELRNWKR